MPQVLHKSTLSPTRQPFLYLTAALVLGILVDRWTEPSRLTVAVFAAVCLAVTVTELLFKRDAAATTALLLSFAAAGALLSLIERTPGATSKLARLYELRIISPDDPVELTGTLAAPPEPAPGAFYLDLVAEKLEVRGEVRPATGMARLMISPSDGEAQNKLAALSLDYGSRICVLVRLERARSYSNPGSPDFNEFLERRGYDLKGVIKSPLLIEHIGHSNANRALASLFHLRLRMMDAIDSKFTPRVAGTLKAMLAGNRYFLDRETVQRLQQSSTFHTLVISGLHFGIIAWVLLGGRSTLKRRNTLRVLVCLLVLWAYAIMVGLVPPVTRAAAMITAGLIGPVLFRRQASINTLSLTAFVMLALDPDLVADPAFQLSFVAVAGIVSLALPLAEKLRQIGQWRPTSHTPHPPSCSPTVRYLAETLFWDERAFSMEMRRSVIRYRLEKAGSARLLGRLRIQSLLRNVVLLMITSTGIQLATLPLMAFYFNRVSPVGVLLNVVAGLLTGVLMLTALGVILVGGISTWLSAHLGLIVNAAHYLLVHEIEPFVSIPFATFRSAHYEGWHAIVYALYFVPLALVAVIIDRWRPVDSVEVIDQTGAHDAVRRKRKASRRSRRAGVVLSWLSALGMSAALMAVINPPTTWVEGALSIHFLDVGQGDSAFLVFPRGKTMLVDGGGELRFGRPDRNQKEAESEDESVFVDRGFSIGESVVSRFIWSLGRTRIDYVVATHAHADHIGGLSDVAANFRVGQAIVGHAPVADPEYSHFAKNLALHRIPIFAVKMGEVFAIDGVRIEVLWPPRADGEPVTSGNNDSVVLRLVYGSVSILLAGDIEQAAEESLVGSGLDLRADLLKVAHHGSRTSSTEEFIDAVNPRFAVISVGERSRFGHPHALVVNRYLARDARVFQTGLNGTVTVETNGTTLDCRIYRK